MKNPWKIAFFGVVLILISVLVGYYLGNRKTPVGTSIFPTPTSYQLYPSSTPTSIATSTAQNIIRTVGEREDSFLSQKINPDSVEGLFYSKYPIPDLKGTPRTLHIGDDIGYTCEGVSEILTRIDFVGQKMTFTKVSGQRPPAACPKCLADKTLIDTPSGLVLVKNLQVGMLVWTIDQASHRIPGIIAKTSKVPVPQNHQMVYLVLSDGRELYVSPGHPTTDGKTVVALKVGDRYDNSTVKSNKLIPYWDNYTYDLLPAGDTGFYFANGIVMGSTLKTR